jgi:hypothetical protein
VDDNNNRVWGHVIASDILDDAYVVKMDDIMDSIGKQLEANVRLPSPGEVLAAGQKESFRVPDPEPSWQRSLSSLPSAPSERDSVSGQDENCGLAFGNGISKLPSEPPFSTITSLTDSRTRVAVAGTNALALMIAAFIVHETGYQIIVLSRAVGGAAMPWFVERC